MSEDSVSLLCTSAAFVGGKTIDAGETVTVGRQLSKELRSSGRFVPAPEGENKAPAKKSEPKGPTPTAKKSADKDAE